MEYGRWNKRYLRHLLLVKKDGEFNSIGGSTEMKDLHR